MKKRTILIAVIAAALVAGGTATALVADTPMRRVVESYFSSGDGAQGTAAVAAKVNGKPILQKNVDAELMMYDVLTAYVDVNGGTSLPEEWQNKRPTQAEVLEKLIRNAVIEQEAERLKLTVPQEEARKVAAQQYQVLKDAASREDEVNKDARGYYQSLVDYREARHLTEKQYINESANVYRALMLRGKVKEAFLTDYQGDDPDGAWDAHLSSLIAQADIAYSTAEK